MNRKYQIIWTLLRPVVTAFIRLKFGYTFEKAENLPENYIVLSNHVTDFDPLFVAASFPRQMFFVASEHIARWKFIYPILKFLLAPIIRYKGTVATSTVVEVLRKIRKGGNVAIFAGGIRTWDGVTSPILPSTAKLVQSAKCGLVTYKLTGGYFVSPNWSEGGTRRGPIHGAPVNIYTREQLAAMSVEEIYGIITRDLHEDAYARQLADPKPYRGRQIACKMENLLFICPECGGHDVFCSEGDRVTCKNCGMEFTYDEYGMLHGAPFRTVKEFADWQKKKVVEDAAKGIVYASPTATLSTLDKHIETFADQGELTMSGELLKCGSTEIPLADIAEIAIHGRHGLVFTVNRKYYALVPDKASNAYRFVLYFNAWKNKTLEKVG